MLDISRLFSVFFLLIFHKAQQAFKVDDYRIRLLTERKNWNQEMKFMRICGKSNGCSDRKRIVRYSVPQSSGSGEKKPS